MGLGFGGELGQGCAYPGQNAIQIKSPWFLVMGIWVMLGSDGYVVFQEFRPRGEGE